MTTARELTGALGGRWAGTYGLAFCPAHDNRRTPALTLADAPDGRLLANCKAGCGFADVLNALRGRGLIVGAHTPVDPAVQAQRQAAAHAEAEKRARQAEALWRESRPIAGTLAETYLQRRGITCALPDTLRFHPECWHGPSAKRLPAMVALVEGADTLAVHRTFLRPDGSGKADVPDAKLMLGRCTGGAVRLADGQALVVAEGIETALSLASGLLRRPAAIWAALSAPGMAAMRVPGTPGRLTVATDGDDAGRAAGRSLAKRATALGWTVSLLPAPEGRDWNDILTMKGSAE